MLKKVLSIYGHVVSFKFSCHRLPLHSIKVAPVPRVHRSVNKFLWIKTKVLTCLIVPIVQLTTNFDSITKFTIEKCVRANLFNEFLSGIVKKWPEMMVLRGSYVKDANFRLKQSTVLQYCWYWLRYKKCTGHKWTSIRSSGNFTLSIFIHWGQSYGSAKSVSYTHLTLPTNREV